MTAKKLEWSAAGMSPLVNGSHCTHVSVDSVVCKKKIYLSCILQTRDSRCLALIMHGLLKIDFLYPIFLESNHWDKRMSCTSLLVILPTFVAFTLLPWHRGDELCVCIGEWGHKVVRYSAFYPLTYEIIEQDAGDWLHVFMNNFWLFCQLWECSVFQCACLPME
jgi:hypothetical protein